MKPSFFSPKYPPLLSPPIPYNALSAFSRFKNACRQNNIRPTNHLLWARLKSQTLLHLVRDPLSQHPNPFMGFEIQKKCRLSSSRFGIGQKCNSNCTPLGLHRIAAKIGGGYPVGAVFKSRQPIGYVWQGMPDAAIAHCILWLEGLEPGLNRGGEVDTFTRYIYLHGVGDELTLGKPASRGCLHLASDDILLLYYRVPCGTLVWIEDCN